MKEVYKKLFEFREKGIEVAKNSDNNYLKTKYADLNSVMDATDGELQELGLLWVDRPKGMTLESDLILIETGETLTIVSDLLVAKQDMQSYGSAITYARRYNRIALLGLQVVDDDASEASGKTFVKPKMIREINELILGTKTDARKFLSHYKVDAVKNLPEDKGQLALATLKKKKQLMEKGGDDGNNQEN